MTRIESGAVSPSFDLAQEILTVLGEPIGFTGVADTAAVAAGRLALDPTLHIAVTTPAEAWLRRWARIGLVDPLVEWCQAGRRTCCSVPDGPRD